MRTWSVQDAEARFDELQDACLAEGPQTVTRNGVAVAVLVTLEEWERLQSLVRPSLKQLLLEKKARTDLLVPAPCRTGGCDSQSTQ